MFKACLKDDILLMTASGDLEMTDIEELEETVLQNIKKGNVKIVLDCSEIRFLSSMDIGIIVRSYNLSRTAGGSFKLAAPSLFVRKIIQKTALDGLFPHYNSVEEAIFSFSGKKKRTLNFKKSNITEKDNN